jgi:4-amino-4-deoxy-L-arabinose transferase-like glycosyltransferase
MPGKSGKIDYKYEIILVSLLVLLAGFLRFYNIQNVGLKFYDEGVYLLEGNWFNGNVFFKYNYLSPLKPLHSFLISIGLRIFGYNDYSGLIVSAFLGTATIPIVYLIGKKLYDWKTGIIASIILAVMGLHIIYSRAVLSEVNMTFFFSLAFLIYILATKRNNNSYFILSGIIFGLAYEVRYLAGILFLIPLIIEILQRKPAKIILKNMFLIVIPFLAVFSIGWLYYAMNGVNYLKLLCEYFGIGTSYQGSSSIFESLIMYVYFIIKTVSPITLIFFAIGLYFVIRKLDSFILIWLIVWVAFLFFFGHNRDRDLIPLLPALALIAARGFSIFESKKAASILSRIHIEPELAAVISITLILLSSLFSDANYITFTSPYYKEASEFLLNDGVIGTLSNNPSLVAFYTEKPADYVSDIVKNELSNFSSKEFSHVLIEDGVSGRCVPVKTMVIETLYRRVYKMDYDSWWFKASDWLFGKFNISIKKYTNQVDSVTAERIIWIYRLGDVLKCLG